MLKHSKRLDHKRCVNPPLVVRHTAAGYLLNEKALPKSQQENFLLLIIRGLVGFIIFMSFAWLMIPLSLIALFFCLFSPNFHRSIRASLFLTLGDLTFSHYPLQLGHDSLVIFQRQLKGNRRCSRNSLIQINLLCMERVMYTRGSDTTIETTVVEEKLLKSETIMAGASQITCQFKLPIPADLPPSFEAHNNQIRWIITVEQTIPGTVKGLESNFTLLVNP